MPIELPDPTLIRKKFPEIKEITHIATGGFKAVYEAKVSNIVEAVKLVQISITNDSEEEKSVRKEFIGRIEREVSVLEKIKARELVKLGSIKPQLIDLNGKEYYAYSEEFIHGKNIFEIIKESIKANSPKPNESELRQLYVALLKAIKELWALGYIHRDIK